jgi:V/A-type H+-transporting ATPase subunit I
MGLAQVEKVQILAHASSKMRLLSTLQEVGIVELTDVDKEELGLGLPLAEVSHLDQFLHRLKHGLDFLSRWEEKGFLEKLLTQKPVLSREEREELLRFAFRPVLDKIEKIEAERNELLSRIKFLEKEVEFLLPLASLDLPLALFKSSNQLEIQVGSLPLSQREAFEDMVANHNLWCEMICRGGRTCLLLLFFLKKERDFFEERLKELQFSPVYLAEPVLTKACGDDGVRDIIEDDHREIEKTREDIAGLDAEAKKMIVHRDQLAQIYDVLHNEQERLSSSRMLGETEKVAYLEGWVRSSDVRALKDALAPYGETSEIYLRPPLHHEDPPVVLENPKPAQPFEVITRLYGLPGRDSFDPTIALAPFFFIFVGLCVSEAGYGLVVTLLSLMYMKFAKPKGNALLFMKLLFLLGISNIVLGTLVGAWFGFPVRQLLLIDPLKDPLKFLALSLILGFIQVWFGTLLNLIGGVKKKNYVQSIFVQGGWLLLLPSLVAYFLTKQSLWGILALIGAAGVVFFAAPKRNPLARFFGGLYSLYDISKYLGDTLSYSRLLALGLSTGVIAMVVNTLAKSALGIPWVGWFFAALIFVGGHLFNLAISFLGGFVHSMRLQFVEFFTKFFQAGGRPFKPFKLEGRYVEFH